MIEPPTVLGADNVRQDVRVVVEEATAKRPVDFHPF
jgi:hypothetical protein